MFSLSDTFRRLNDKHVKVWISEEFLVTGKIIVESFNTDYLVLVKMDGRINIIPWNHVHLIEEM